MHDLTPWLHVAGCLEFLGRFKRCVVKEPNPRQLWSLLYGQPIKARTFIDTVYLKDNYDSVFGIAQSNGVWPSSASSLRWTFNVKATMDLSP
jgi:hypothetical protein